MLQTAGVWPERGLSEEEPALQRAEGQSRARARRWTLVSWLPSTAVTNYYKVSDLKQHECIILQTALFS